MRHIIYILIILATGTILTSCQDERETYIEPVEMVFMPAVTPVSGMENALYPEAQPFGIWACTLPYGKTWDDNRDEASVLINGEMVSKGNEGWKTDVTHLWDDRCLTTFFAWAPYSQPSSFSPDEGICFDQFDILSDMPDPLYASSLPDMEKPEIGGFIALPFEQSLSYVGFKVRAAIEDGYRAELKNAVVRNVARSGRFHSLPHPKWESDGRTFDYMLFEGSMPLGAELIPACENHRMLPQDLDLSVELAYNIYSEDGTYFYPDQKIRTNCLKVTWIPGQAYTYSITLTATDAVINKEILD